jgi:hypothetical protein
MSTKPLRETGAALSVAQKQFASIRQNRSSRLKKTPTSKSRMGNLQSGVDPGLVASAATRPDLPLVSWRLCDKNVCGLPEGEELWAIGRGFIVRDLPWTVEKLRAIPPFEFENWAVIALGGIANKSKVGDMGIDGRIFPVGAEPLAPGHDELQLHERW